MMLFCFSFSQEDHIDNLDMKKATQVLQIIAVSFHNFFNSLKVMFKVSYGRACRSMPKVSNKDITLWPFATKRSVFKISKKIRREC